MKVITNAVRLFAIVTVAVAIWPLRSLGEEQPVPGSPAGAAAAPSDVHVLGPGDIVFSRKDVDKQKSELAPPAVFSHWVHRMRFRCYVCHLPIFKMKRGAETITHEKMDKGSYCVVCHDGTLAWRITQDNCQRCHKPVVAPAGKEKGEGEEEEEDEEE